MDNPFLSLPDVDQGSGAATLAAPTPAAPPYDGGGWATVFGLNPDGTPDPEDNGIGHWGANTRDPSLAGVSLPRSVLRDQYGDAENANGRLVEVTNPQTGQSQTLPIVDIGPGEDTGNALDLTYAANQQLGGNGKTPMQYRFADGAGPNPFLSLPDAADHQPSAPSNPFLALPDAQGQTAAPSNPFLALPDAPGSKPAPAVAANPFLALPSLAQGDNNWSPQEQPDQGPFGGYVNEPSLDLAPWASIWNPVPSFRVPPAEGVNGPGTTQDVWPNLQTVAHLEPGSVTTSLQNSMVGPERPFDAERRQMAQRMIAQGMSQPDVEEVLSQIGMGAENRNRILLGNPKGLMEMLDTKWMPRLEGVDALGVPRLTYDQPTHPPRDTKEAALNAFNNLQQGLLTPKNILIAAALPGAGTAIQKAAAAYFGVTLTKDAADKLGEAIEMPPGPERNQVLMEGGATGILGLLGLAHVAARPEGGGLLPGETPATAAAARKSPTLPTLYARMREAGINPSGSPTTPTEAVPAAPAAAPASDLLASPEHQQYLADLTDPAKAAAMARRPDGSTVINADDFVAGSPAMKAATLDQGQQVYEATKAAANQARQDAFEYLIKQPISKQGEVLFTVGGPGSGKSSIGAKLQDAEFVMDSVHGDPDQLANRIQNAVDSGRSAHVVFVERDPGDAMRGNLSRAFDEKRLASADALANSHVNARNSFLDVQQRFADQPNVTFEALRNVTNEAPEIFDPSAVRPLDLDATRQRVHNVLNAIANEQDPEWTKGPIPESILRIARGDRSPPSSDDGEGAQGVWEGGGGGETSGSAAPQDHPSPLAAPGPAKPANPDPAADSWLGRKANRARQRIEDRFGGGNLLSDPLLLRTAGGSVANLLDHAIIGASYVARRIEDFGEWSKAMAADLGDLFPQDHEYRRRVFDSAKELIGHIRDQDASNPISDANLPTADQQGTRADGSPQIQWTQTAGANGAGALRVGDKFNLGMPVRIAATDFQASPEMPADYVQHEVSEILHGPGNQVAIRSRDMTPEEIARKQTSLESQNDRLHELGLPGEPIPPVPASVALRFGDSTTAVRPQSGLEAQKAPNLADSTLSWLEQKAEAARQRIVGRRGNMYADPLGPLGPTAWANLFDHAIIGASYLLKGVVKFARWSKAMAAELGNSFPRDPAYQRKVFDSARELVSQIREQDSAIAKPEANSGIPGEVDQTAAKLPVGSLHGSPANAPGGHPRIEQLVRQTLQDFGIRNSPEVTIVKSAADLPDHLATDEVRTRLGRNSIPEAWFTDAGGQRRIVILKDGADAVARARGISFAARIRQLALHEVVHHLGSLRALLPPEAHPAYDALVDGLLAKLQRTFPKEARFLALPEAQGGYGFDLTSPKGRGAAVEELLGRFNESWRDTPSWIQHKIAQFRALLRRYFPSLGWTDADVRSLLYAATRRRIPPVPGRGTVSFSMQPPPEDANSPESSPEGGSGSERDPVSKQWLNGKVHVSILGQDREPMAEEISMAKALMLAPDGAHITLDVSNLPFYYRVEIDHPLYAKPAVQRIYPQGRIYDDFLALRQQGDRNGSPPKRFAARLLARQVKNAAAMGYKEIELEAAGRKGSLYNGYYTWPRYGFDARLTSSDIQMLPSDLRAARTLLDLMATERGRTWWYENGRSKILKFDLTPGSRSNKVLGAYLRQHGLNP